MNIFVGRQPILDVNENLYGYELLYRDGKENAFPNINSDAATIELLINTFVSIGSDEIVGKSLSFINFTGKLLTEDIFDSLDPTRVVIEILEDVAITPSLLTRLRELKEKGFRMALDDFILQEQYRVHSQIFELIDYIKVDFMETNEEERAGIVQFLKKYSNIVLLAEKVETKEDFQKAKASGYTLFQGYFFAQPEVISGFEIPPKPILHLRIIDLLNEENPDIEEVAALIKQDISLSYKLLRVINSSGIGIVRKVSSIQQAIVLLGLKEMKKWMHVFTLRELGDGELGGRTGALINYSLTRAKMCEQLAKGKHNADEYFLAGLFSLMDVILKRDWQDILELIPLSDNVENTLMGIETTITPYLELVEAIERFDSKRLDELAKILNVDQEMLGIYSQRANLWGQAFS